MRIGKQIDEGLRVRLGMNRKDAKARAIELLELVGIPSPVERYSAYPVSSPAVCASAWSLRSPWPARRSS